MIARDPLAFMAASLIFGSFAVILAVLFNMSPRVCNALGCCLAGAVALVGGIALGCWE